MELNTQIIILSLGKVRLCMVVQGPGLACSDVHQPLHTNLGPTKMTSGSPDPLCANVHVVTGI